MKNTIILLAMLWTSTVLAQNEHTDSHREIKRLRAASVYNLDPHHHRHPFRVALLMGHGMVPDVHHTGVHFVPSWGLDIDYHLSDNWSLGWHSDVEIENYIIVEENGDFFELAFPTVSTLDLFYRLNNNVLFGAGPGFTVEHGKVKSLFRVGIEGEVQMNDRWEWTPTVYYDQRFDGHGVLSLAVGIAHYL
jgi:hypothetical protein